jgi:hypothetical protein
MLSIFNQRGYYMAKKKSSGPRPKSLKEMARRSAWKGVKKK